MLPIADFIIQISFYVSLYCIISLIVGITLLNRPFIQTAIHSFYVSFLLLITDLIILIILFFNKDYTSSLVSSTTSKDLPLLYSLASVWAVEEGQFLIFCCLISFFILLKIRQDKKQNNITLPKALLVMSLIQGFFIAVLFFSLNPFVQSAFTPVNGEGLKPILQNPWIFIHPLTTYLSYSAMVIPFSCCFGSIITDKKHSNWIDCSKVWILLSWTFLLGGSATGAAWAYMADNFSGIWRWDIVEVTALLPFLCLTGLLHSIIIEEKRKMFSSWNTLLTFLTFILISFSIWISHSKTIVTTHRFSESKVENLLFGFCISVFACCALAFIRQKKDTYKKKTALDSLFSRESGFLFNNLIIISLISSLFLGITFPYISKAIKGDLISVKQPYYNEITYPLLCVLMAHTGICLMLAWKKTTVKTLKKTAITPLFLTLAIGSLIFYIYEYSFSKVYFSHLLSLFVITMACMEIYKEIKIGLYPHKNLTISKTGYVIIKRSKKYLGHIIHIGMAVAFIGITGGFNNVSKTISLYKGDSYTLKGYTFTHDGIFPHNTYNGRFAVEASLFIKKDGKSLGRLTPQKNFFENRKKPLSQKAVLSTWKFDIVVNLDSYLESEESFFTISFFPYLKWLWTGIWIMSISTFLYILLISRAVRQKTE